MGPQLLRVQKHTSAAAPVSSTTLLALETDVNLKREVAVCDWDMEYIFILYMHQEGIFLQRMFAKLFVRACVFLFFKTVPYTLRRLWNGRKLKANFFFHLAIFHSRIWKMNNYIKRSTLSSLSILFVMKDGELYITLSTLGGEYNIKNPFEGISFLFYKKTIIWQWWMHI